MQRHILGLAVLLLLGALTVTEAARRVRRIRVGGNDHQDTDEVDDDRDDYEEEEEAVRHSGRRGNPGAHYGAGTPRPRRRNDDDVEEIIQDDDEEDDFGVGGLALGEDDCDDDNDAPTSLDIDVSFESAAGTTTLRPRALHQGPPQLEPFGYVLMHAGGQRPRHLYVNDTQLAIPVDARALLVTLPERNRRQGVQLMSYPGVEMPKFFHAVKAASGYQQLSIYVQVQDNRQSSPRTTTTTTTTSRNNSGTIGGTTTGIISTGSSTGHHIGGGGRSNRGQSGRGRVHRGAPRQHPPVNALPSLGGTTTTTTAPSSSSSATAKHSVVRELGRKDPQWPRIHVAIASTATTSGGGGITSQEIGPQRDALLQGGLSKDFYQIPVDDVQRNILAVRLATGQTIVLSDVYAAKSEGRHVPNVLLRIPCHKRGKKVSLLDYETGQSETHTKARLMATAPTLSIAPLAQPHVRIFVEFVDVGDD